MSDAFQQAWSLVKMPIIEPIPGVKVGYWSGEGLGEDEIDPKQVISSNPRPAEEIGWIPHATNVDSRMAMMTPDEYFDVIAPHTTTQLGKRGIDGYRWTPHLSSKRNIARIIEGIKEGKMIGAPMLGFGGKQGYTFDERNTTDKAWGYKDQEGGHRMEALRQMGYGDKKIPVLLQRNFHTKPAERLDEKESRRQLQKLVQNKNSRSQFIRFRKRQKDRDKERRWR